MNKAQMLARQYKDNLYLKFQKNVEKDYSFIVKWFEDAISSTDLKYNLYYKVRTNELYSYSYIDILIKKLKENGFICELKDDHDYDEYTDIATDYSQLKVTLPVEN